MKEIDNAFVIAVDSEFTRKRGILLASNHCLKSQQDETGEIHVQGSFNRCRDCFYGCDRDRARSRRRLRTEEGMQRMFGEESLQPLCSQEGLQSLQPLRREKEMQSL